jgi:hypothetical protein
VRARRRELRDIQRKLRRHLHGRDARLIGINMFLSRFVGLTLAIVVVLAGCRASTSSADAAAGKDAGPDAHAVRATDYDRACVRDSDCVLVAEGTIGCCGIGCPNAAIATSAQATYQADVSARTPICTPSPPCVAIASTGDLCGDPVAACVDGSCAMLTCEKVGCPRGAFCARIFDETTWGCMPFPGSFVTDGSTDGAAPETCQGLAAEVEAIGACPGGDATCTLDGGTFLVSCTSARD